MEQKTDHTDTLNVRAGRDLPTSKWTGSESPTSKRAGSESPTIKNAGSESPTAKMAGSRLPTSNRAGSESPTSKCPICLSMIDNPAFTDICIHQFCYTCLCEWAKVKAVCPVCKQEFQSIAYNVQSYGKFDELPVKNLIVLDTHTRFHDDHTGFQINAILSRRASQIHGHPQDVRFRYRTTMTSDYRDVLRRLEEQRIIEELRNPLVRVTVNHRTFVFSSNARKAVYRTGLRVQHLQTAVEQVFSVINPQFFNDNPACKIRLSPWLQRELDVMAELSDIPIGDTMFLISFIFPLLNTLKITSQCFYNKVYPYLGRYTLHFLQELYCFARSAPYTMPQYDSCVVYGDGTSGAIWSVWHRDKARSNSSISTGSRDDHREDVIQIPSERSFVSFVLRNHRGNVNQSSDIPVQRITGIRANSYGPIDLVQGPSDSSSDVEVVGQEPPWDARGPIVICDSEEETLRREERVESGVDRVVKYPVSETPREHQNKRMSKDPSQASVHLVNEQKYHRSEPLSYESGMQISLANSQKRKFENEGGDRRRDSSDVPVEEIAGPRLKTKCRQNSFDDWQNHRKGHCQKHANHLKSKDRMSQASHSGGDYSCHSKDLRRHFERSSKEHSTSTEERKPYKHSSREQSRSYQRRHSKDRSRRIHRSSHSKERVGSSNPSKEQSKVAWQSFSKQHDCIPSRSLHGEHRERHSDYVKPSSPEFSSCSLEKLDGCLKERQHLHHTMRKRHNSGQTSHSDFSEVEAVRRLSSNRTNVCEHSYVSSASNSQSSSVSRQNLSHVHGCLASCSHNLVGEDVKGDRELRLETDSFSLSYNETISDIYPSNVSQVSNSSSKVIAENNDSNDCSFIRKTYFWSDEEESNEDVIQLQSQTLKSQIGCMLLRGNCGALSVLEPLSVDEELIVIESSDCSSSSQRCLSKDYDTNETGSAHKDRKRKHRGLSCTSSKKSHTECDLDIWNVSRDSRDKESSCSLESQQSERHKSRRLTSYKQCKKERWDMDKDLKSQLKTNCVKSQMDVKFSINKFDKNSAQCKMNDLTDDDVARNAPLNVAAEMKFKKHFTGHKNLCLKTD